MKLSNTTYAGKTLVTAFGNITFDKDGNANVSDEAVEALTKLPGFTTDYTTPAEDDTDKGDEDGGETHGENDKTLTDGDSGAVEHAEGGQQKNTQGDENDTQNGDENGKNDEETPGDEALTEEQLKKLQVPSLKKLCKDKGLDITGITTKQPLINLLLGR